MNRTKKILLAILALSISFMSIWFIRQPKPTKPKAKIIRTYLSSKVSTTDPGEIKDLYGAYLVAKTFESLTTFAYTNSSLEAEPLLLKSMPKISKDGLVYTFTLKEGVRFHDNPCFVDTQGKGPEITAQDVAYSLIRIFDPAIHCKSINFLEAIKGSQKFREARKNNPATPYEIEGIKVTGKYTFEIILKHALPELPFFLAMPFTSIVSKKAVEFYGENFKYHPVGTGPWTLKIFDPRASKHHFKKNQAYHGTFPKVASQEYDRMRVYEGKQLPLADELHIHIITEASAAWLKFQKGGLDIDLWQIGDVYVKNLTPEKKPTKDLQEKGIKVVPSIPHGMMFLHFNLNVPFLKNKKVRQAITLAIDLNRIKKVVYDDNGFIPQGLILPDFQGYDANYKAPYVNECNIEKAKKILEEAGFTKEKTMPPFVLYCPNRSNLIKMAQCIKEDLEKIGMIVVIKIISFNDMLTKVKKIFTIGHSGCFIGWGLDFPVLINFFQLFYSKNIGGNNSSFYKNEEYDALYEKALVMKPSHKRTELFKKMIEILVRDIPSLPIIARSKYVFYHKHIKNMRSFTTERLNIDKYLAPEEA